MLYPNCINIIAQGLVHTLARFSSQSWEIERASDRECCNSFYPKGKGREVSACSNSFLVEAWLRKNLCTVRGTKRIGQSLESWMSKMWGLSATHRFRMRHCCRCGSESNTSVPSGCPTSAWSNTQCDSLRRNSSISAMLNSSFCQKGS
jgi:hypothetical protein